MLLVDQRVLIRNLCLTHSCMYAGAVPGLYAHTDGLVSAVAPGASESAANRSQCPIWLPLRLAGGPTGEDNGSSVEVQLLKEGPYKGVCTGCVLQQRA